MLDAVSFASSWFSIFLGEYFMRFAAIMLVAFVATAAPVQAGTSFTADFSGPTLDSHFVDHDSKYTADGTAHITAYGGTSNDKFYLSTVDVDYADSDWVMELNYTQIGSANTQWNPIEVTLGPQEGVSIDKAAYNEPNANVFLSIYPSDPWSDTNGILMLSESYLENGTKEVWRSTTDGLSGPGNGTHTVAVTKVGRELTYTIDDFDYYTHYISDEAWGWMYGTWGSGTGSAISFGTAADGSQVTFNSFSVEVVPGDDIPGDANRDGKVDGSDVTILAGNWQAGVGSPNPLTVTWDMGDFNGDGQIDGSDVTILAGNWQAGVTAAAASVPEPTTMLLLVSLVGSLLIWKRKN